jgi:hypothetical protein
MQSSPGFSPENILSDWLVSCSLPSRPREEKSVTMVEMTKN